ncbi:hypothetical protein ACIRO3_23295 [Streptomyces sp. NPDC102278]|uniref:ATP-dependent DNA ligase n=1 Tax=Streptomyces sp. NPDC102278 TaxID=3366152 RepID=UPI0037F3FE01
MAAAEEQLPDGLVLDGELLVWDPEAGRLSFEALQRRAAAPAQAARTPAYFVAFDILQAEGVELLALPYRERRRRMEVNFTARGLTAPWTLCPMATDPVKAREWLEDWTDVSGMEGLVVKRTSQRYLPGARLDQDQTTRHHRSDHRRHHRHPHPPTAPGPRPPRPGWLLPQHRPHRPPTPRRVPPRRRTPGARRPRTSVDGSAVRLHLGLTRHPGHDPGPPGVGRGDLHRPRRRLPPPPAPQAAAPGRRV